MAKDTWTEDRIERLKAGFDAGLSCSEIAGEIGVSRNAVIGKMSRLRLTRIKQTTAGQPERRPVRRLRYPRLSQRRILVAIRPAAEAMPVDTRFKCSLLELGQANCRWPISEPGAEDFCFCGSQPVEGLPYCPGHARLAYRRTAAPQDRAAS